LKQILTGILAIVNSREKIKLGKLIIFDLVTGILDIVFLGLLLVVIDFYIKKVNPPKISLLPNSLLNQNSLVFTGIFLLLFCIKNGFGYFGLKSLQQGDFVGISGISRRGGTRLVNLLPGFLESKCRTTSLNNKTTNSIELQPYEQKISYVKQQPFFIHDSIVKNTILAEDSYNRIKLDEE
jgi:hypothetical protein